MIIANPIYDVVFKRLMEDERIAKFFIGTLLNEVIEEVQIKPQEYIYEDKMAGLAVYRVDFIATIKTATGEFKKVLIEIQKAKNLVDLMRFRNYLAEQYKREDEIETISGKSKTALPIVTIYLLGFSLPEVDTSVVHVARQYIDLNTNQIIDKKSEFIEKLTHDSFVVQMTRIGTKYQTKLDKLLSVFEQTNFVDETRIIKKYDYKVDDEGVKTITDILHYIGTEPEEKKQIEDEREAYRVLDAAIRENTEKLKIELSKAQKVIEGKDKALEDKDKALEDKDKVIEDKDKALENSLKIIEELKRKLGEA